MKIIEALKQLPDLARKRDDLTAKAAKYCARYDLEQEAYENQTAQVKKWIQKAVDINATILSLRVRIQLTNLVTTVQIEIAGTMVTKSIAEWIHRRRDLSVSDMKIWKVLGDKSLFDQKVKDSTGEIKKFLNQIEEYASERALIDAALEIKNAVTDLK